MLFPCLTFHAFLVVKSYIHLFSLYASTTCTKIHAPTFVTHDCDLHSSIFKDPQTLPLAAVLHVTEVKARHKDPEAKVGGLTEELGQSKGAVGARRPGTEPGNRVTEPSLPSTSVPPKTRAQGSYIAQEKHLWRKSRMWKIRGT